MPEAFRDRRLHQGRSFHSARWDHDLRPCAARTWRWSAPGASAISSSRAIQPEVKTLTLFQRTPAVDRALARSQPIGALDTSSLLAHPRPRFSALRFEDDLLATREIAALMFMRPRLSRRFFQKARGRAPGPLGRRPAPPRQAHAFVRVRVQAHPHLGRLLSPRSTRPNVDIVTDAHPRRSRLAGSSRRTAREHAVDLDHLRHGLPRSRTTRSAGISSVEAGRTCTSDGAPRHDRAPRDDLSSGFPNLFMLQGPNTGARPHVGHRR